MKTQKVSVDVWAMIQSMLGYLALAILGGIFIRLVITVITLPKRLRQQKDNVQKAMDELRTRYPDVFKDVENELNEKEKVNEIDDGKQCIIEENDKSPQDKKIN